MSFIEQNRIYDVDDVRQNAIKEADEGWFFPTLLSRRGALERTTPLKNVIYIVEEDWRAPRHAWFEDFQHPDVLVDVAFEAAPEAIRKYVKEYFIAADREPTKGYFPITQKWVAPVITQELNDAITASQEILKIEIDLEAGINVPYQEDTLKQDPALQRGSVNPHGFGSIGQNCTLFRPSRFACLQSCAKS